FVSNIYATHLTGASQVAVEKQKLQANLIIEAVKTGDAQKAVQNLQFFLDAGFLDDPEGKIKQLIEKNLPPVLPAQIESWYRDLLSSADTGDQRAMQWLALLRAGEYDEVVRLLDAQLSGKEAEIQNIRKLRQELEHAKSSPNSR